MEALTMYGIRNCDTVKKARAWLDGRGVEYWFHDCKVAGVDMAQLERWCEALALMRAQPSVIRRPVVELKGKLIVGFRPELYESLRW
jgi:arsenate reductase